MKRINAVATWALLTVTNSSLAYADPVELSAFVALKRPAPTEVIEYGTAPSQAVDLFLPTGDGPHPLAMSIHGGCWSVTTAGREQLRHLGAELAKQGIAVWSTNRTLRPRAGPVFPRSENHLAHFCRRLGLQATRTLNESI